MSGDLHKHITLYGTTFNSLSKLNSKRAGDDFIQRKRTYLEAQLKQHKESIRELLWTMASSCPSSSRKQLLRCLVTLEKNPFDIDKLSDHCAAIDLSQTSTHTEFKLPPKIPLHIKEYVHSDFDELIKCFDAQAYRSAIILCGRILEATLHYKYFKVTGFDILEKNPGIGLGTLVAKLKEKDVELDPAILQQIHLINQVRIFSVHKKHQAYNPTANQAKAIILYTLDVLEELI